MDGTSRVRQFRLVHRCPAFRDRSRPVPNFRRCRPQNEDVPDRIARALQKGLQSRALPGTVAFMPQTDLVRKTLQFVFKVENPSPLTCLVALDGVSPAPLADLLPLRRSCSGSRTHGFTSAAW